MSGAHDVSGGSGTSHSRHRAHLAPTFGFLRILGLATLFFASTGAVLARAPVPPAETTTEAGSSAGTPTDGAVKAPAPARIEVRPVSEGGTLRVDYREQALPYVAERNPGTISLGLRGEKRGEWASCHFTLLPGRTFVWKPDIRQDRSSIPPRAAAFRKADLAMGETRYARAIELFRQFIEDHPGHCDALRAEVAIHRIEALLAGEEFFPDQKVDWRTEGYVEVVSPVKGATGSMDHRPLRTVPGLEATTSGMRTLRVEAPGQKPWVCLVAVPRNRALRFYVDPLAEDADEQRPSARLMAEADAAVAGGDLDRARELWLRLARSYPRSCEAHRIGPILEAFEAAPENEEAVGEVGWLRVEMAAKVDRACRRGLGAELRVSIAGRLCRLDLERRWDLPPTKVCGPLPAGAHRIGVVVNSRYGRHASVGCGDSAEFEITPGDGGVLMIEVEGDCNRFWPMSSDCDLRLVVGEETPSRHRRRR